MKKLMLALLVSSVAVSSVVADEAEQRSFIVMDTVSGEIDVFGENGSFVAITENEVDGSLNVETFDNQDDVTPQTTDVAISNDDSVVSDS